jgi:uncharacterized protein (DUF427 family)
MNAKVVLIPSPSHPISIVPQRGRVTVLVADRAVADSRRALVLAEAAYRLVHYIQRDDVDMPLLQRSFHATYCPYKGDCAYYSIPVGGPRAVNAAWTYEEPYPAVSPIKGHIAFYWDRVDEIRLLPEDQHLVDSRFPPESPATPEQYAAGSLSPGGLMENR